MFVVQMTQCSGTDQAAAPTRGCEQQDRPAAGECLVAQDLHYEETCTWAALVFDQDKGFIHTRPHQLVEYGDQ